MTFPSGSYTQRNVHEPGSTEQIFIEFCVAVIVVDTGTAIGVDVVAKDTAVGVGVDVASKAVVVIAGGPDNISLIFLFLSSNCFLLY